MTTEQKNLIRDGLKSVTVNRIGFVRWMIRMFNAR